MCDLYVVTVDTRGRSSSDIKGYQEHVCSRASFIKNIAQHPDAICYKSEIAKLCGLDLTVYFHNHEGTIIGPATATGSSSNNTPLQAMDTNNTRRKIPTMNVAGLAARTQLNRAASLLTLDPETGFAKYHVRGIAYVLLNDGLAPLSFQQVWGLQELANYSTDVYKSDPEHASRGKRDLLRHCSQYKKQLWGPLAIYKPRSEVTSTNGSYLPPSEIRLKPTKSKSTNSKSRQHHGNYHYEDQEQIHKSPNRYAIK